MALPQNSFQVNDQHARMDCWRDVRRPAGAGGPVTLGEFAERACSARYRQAIRPTTGTRLKPIKGVKWRDATVKEAPSAFAQEADVTLDGHGRGHRAGRRGAADDVDVEVSLPRLSRRRVWHTLKARFSAATLIEQLGGECREEADRAARGCIA